MNGRGTLQFVYLSMPDLVQCASSNCISATVRDVLHWLPSADPPVNPAKYGIQTVRAAVSAV